MAITVSEKSRRGASGDSPDLDIEYVIEGTDNQADAKAALAAYAATYYGDLRRCSCEAVQVGDGSRFWDGTVRYIQGVAGDRFLRASSGGGTEHTLIAVEHVADYAATGKVAPNYQGLINVHGQGGDLQADGCDVPVEQEELSVTWLIPKALVTEEYMKAVGLLSGKVNDDEAVLVTNNARRTFEAGELLFVGAEYVEPRKDIDHWEWTFHFRVSYNKTNVSIGSSDIEQIPLVRGWWYLWTESPKVADDGEGGSNKTVLRPKFAHLEKVIRSGDFTVLGLHE
jgi:hypothetical protein